MKKGSSTSYEAINIWNNITWWIENYGNEEVLCKDIRNGIAVASCTIQEALQPKDIQYYIVGDAKIFSRHLNLEKMLDNTILNTWKTYFYTIISRLWWYG